MRADRRIRRRVLCLVLALVCLAGRSASADGVDDYVRERMQAFALPGVSIAIVDQGKVVKIAGYGLADVARQTPATPDTVYKQIMDLYDFVGGYGHLVMIGRSGFMTHAETEKSIDLFAREVLPRLKAIAPVQAGFNQQ